jgi:hypothetical protein
MIEFIERFKTLSKLSTAQGIVNLGKERMPPKHCIKNIWLVKPTNLNQGRGIEIFSELDKLLNFINSKTKGAIYVI